MTIHIIAPERQTAEEHTIGRSFNDIEVVCLFSALGLALSAAAMMLGWFDGISALAQPTY